METKVTIALIAAAASLLVALISAVTALITNRASSRTAQSVEYLRQSFANENRKAEISNTEMIASLESLRLAMQALQRIKDEIQLITQARGSSLDAAEALARIRSATLEMLEVNQKHHPNLDPLEAIVLHRAKNISIVIEQVLLEGLGGKRYASELDDERYRALLQHRTALTDAQNLLRDHRTDRLIRDSLTS